MIDPLRKEWMELFDLMAPLSHEAKRGVIMTAHNAINWMVFLLANQETKQS